MLTRPSNAALSHGSSMRRPLRCASEKGRARQVAHMIPATKAYPGSTADGTGLARCRASLQATYHKAHAFDIPTFAAASRRGAPLCFHSRGAQATHMMQKMHLTLARQAGLCAVPVPGSFRVSHALARQPGGWVLSRHLTLARQPGHWVVSRHLTQARQAGLWLVSGSHAG